MGFGQVLAIEHLHNMALPEWITTDVFEMATRAADSAFDFFLGGPAFGELENVELASLWGGIMLNEMIENMEKKIRNETEVLYYAYSGHDMNIAAILRIFGAKEAILGEASAGYASTIVLELWEVAKGSYAVRVRFSMDAKSPFVTVTDKVDGCPQLELCPLNAFIESRQKYIVKNLTERCAAKKN
ncbi:hypothetical protein QR680_008660 [Steinernema hermaphroditum]|uniref:Histidine acid phosphatase n=1 Tax=Steinernema hermaphroditum TaxID=289476 RepID=A0AA39IIX1_9BILA|nr:hypothetical protein QR680_008660 [Steinernema hermaphroditum]